MMTVIKLFELLFFWVSNKRLSYLIVHFQHKFFRGTFKNLIKFSEPRDREKSSKDIFNNVQGCFFCQEGCFTCFLGNRKKFNYFVENKFI
jgi:hypothetical protein